MIRVTYRYLSGRPLDGRDGYPYLSAGNGTLPGWKRQVARIVVPALPVAALVDPHATAATLGAAGLVAAREARRRWARRKFTREYIDPTLAAVTSPLGGVDIDLHIDPTLGSLTPRLAKPLSPAEIKIRSVYGGRVEPAIRWPGEQVMRGIWQIQKALRPATVKLAYFRRPWESPGPRIELRINTPYVTAEQRTLVNHIIEAKIPVADMQPTWKQVGPQVTATWVVRKRPPARVGYAELTAALPGLAEWEFYIGAGPGDTPVTISLHEDSPHIAVSAGSGAGKSVLAQVIAVQVLARGGVVTILDRKGSHRWARDVIGVDYCTQPAQMHDALIKRAALAGERHDLAFQEEDGWDPGARHLIICEELNATIGQLTNYWMEIREKGQDKRSPAIKALADILFMGRSAKVNVLAIAQMLTARAIGGPEARENFAIRFLARYTSNAWKMLVPEAAMPKTSRTLGRWQMVVGGQATEVQVCYLTATQARRLSSAVTGSAADPDSGLSSNVAGNAAQTGNTVDPLDVLVTLRDAIDEGTVPWSKEAAKMRLSRARRAGRPVPEPSGRRGLQAVLYRRRDLAAWVESERVVQ